MSTPTPEQPEEGKPCYICKRQWTEPVPEDSVCSRCHPSVPDYELAVEKYVAQAKREGAVEALKKLLGKSSNFHGDMGRVVLEIDVRKLIKELEAGSSND